MKTRLIAACAAAFFLAPAAGALAQDAPRQGAPTRHASRIDTDNDGRISRAEFLSRIDRMAAQDTDADGTLSRDERRAAMQARMTQRRAEAFARLDADGDGVISRAEFDAPRAKAGAAPRMRPGPHSRRGSIRSASLDLNQMRDRAAQAFDRMDADSDGYLSADERRAARAERRPHRRPHAAGPSPAAPVTE
ncbi:MAG: EF-hand domain-containing protein [Brevundimonas sp.]|uniref:EF-hand domain-containing protein n=1 Tax=Brevundimonas sp. TaxID=1871086 RepID=UPI0025C0F960|nr:EF-hand domain-containing protein [Brevundimonas sp.]MBX3477942.1 EF-hand domain-containing protein [Brevundimonas sp.]